MDRFQIRDVQILVKSFRRFDCLNRLLMSIRRYYPGISVLVADDSFKIPPTAWPPETAQVRGMPNVTWIQLPFDSGLSAGRNELVKIATAPIVLLCDDDFVFTEETRLEALLDVLEFTKFDIAAGLVRMDGRNAMNWGGTLEIMGNRGGFKVEPLTAPCKQTRRGNWYRESDVCLNFFAARREILLEVPWDQRFKVGEHLDHMLMLKQAKARIAYTPDCIVQHASSSENNHDYLPFRQRLEQYRDLFEMKWGSWKRHAIYPEPGIAPCELRTQLDRPNILLFGVGHSGTSIVTRMLHELGWNKGDADEEFSESVAVRDLNTDCIRRRRMQPDADLEIDAAQRALESLPQPWALKDPRFVHTLEDWLPLLGAYKPMMVWLTRDIEAVRDSFRRRNETRMRFALTLEEIFELAQMQYNLWPWKKIQIQYERLSEIFSLFNAAPQKNPL